MTSLIDNSVTGADMNGHLAHRPHGAVPATTIPATTIPNAASRPDSPRTCTVAEAVRSIRRGGFVLIHDDPAGPFDVVGAADRLTTHQAALLIRHSSGFVQVAFRDARGDRLRIPPIAPTTDRMASQQCVGVDAAVGIGTGISAADRARTIRLLGAIDSTPDDFTRPGHVMPIRVAAGKHADDAAAAALNLAERAGSVAAVYATLVTATGTGLPDLTDAAVFAAQHDIPVLHRHSLLPNPGLTVSEGTL